MHACAAVPPDCTSSKEESEWKDPEGACGLPRVVARLRHPCASSGAHQGPAIVCGGPLRGRRALPICSLLTLACQLLLQAEKQKEGQAPEEQTGYKSIVNRNHSNGTTASSRPLHASYVLSFLTCFHDLDFHGVGALVARTFTA
jgi:hypothetical protein